MALTLRHVARSDVGLVRDGNEDSGYAGSRLLAVADGMGGHAAGEVASAVAVTALAPLDRESGDRPTNEDPLEALAAAIHTANQEIRRIVEADPALEGMGTTLTALLWTGSTLGLAHIGDSRAYRLRTGRLEQITRDHTYVQSLVDAGRLSAAEADTHPQRNLMLRALDGRGDPDPDLVALDVRAGDRLLLCSDGLSGVLNDAVIEKALTGSDLTAAAETLVELALKGGAPDNVTIVVADVIAADHEPDGRSSAAGIRTSGASGVAVGAVAEQLGAAGSAAADPMTREGAPWDTLPDATGLGPGGVSALLADEDDPEALRYAPRPPRGLPRWRLTGLLVLLVLGCVLGGYLAYAWTQRQYFVGDDAGQVAVFRGVSQELGPLTLSSVYVRAPGLPVEALPPVYRDRLADTIPADDLDDAHNTVARLRARACQANTPDEGRVGQPAVPSVASGGGEPATTTEPDSGGGPGPTPLPETTPSPSAEPAFPGLSCTEASG